MEILRGRRGRWSLIGALKQSRKQTLWPRPSCGMFAHCRSSAACGLGQNLLDSSTCLVAQRPAISCCQLQCVCVCVCGGGVADAATVTISFLVKPCIKLSLDCELMCLSPSDPPMTSAVRCRREGAGPPTHGANQSPSEKLRDEKKLQKEAPGRRLDSLRIYVAGQ